MKSLDYESFLNTILFFINDKLIFTAVTFLG